MDSRPKTDPRISANTERSTSSAPGPVKAPRQIISSVGRAKIEQLAPNYSESEVATSTSNSYGGPQYYIDYNKNTSGVMKKGVDDSATQKMTATETGSFYSYHSARDISTFVREIGGRMFNSTSELYMLPSDDDEFQRLAKQHYALVLAVNGLYPAAEVVEEILDPARETDRQPSILDLGCGSGIWAIEMAQKFPHASVVGIDLAPAPVDLDSVPTNCRFEIDDINLGLSHYHEHFDVIHVRCIGSGIDNYEDMMLDAEACLRPGGIIIFMDGDMKMYSDDFVSTVPIGLSEAEGGDPIKGSWMYRLARETRLAGIYNGADIEGMEDGIDKGMWGHPLIEPSTIRVASLFAPLGPWAAASDPQETQKLRYSGSLIRQDFIRLGHAWHALLSKAGVPQEMLDEWSKRASDELNENRWKMSHRWRLTWGRRKSTESPAPSRTDTPNDPPTTPNPAYVRTIDSTLSSNRIANGAREYRSFIVYSRREDAARAMYLRKEAAKNLPTPLVEKLRDNRAQTSGDQ